jgi:hypothetical protein
MEIKVKQFCLYGNYSKINLLKFYVVDLPLFEFGIVYLKFKAFQYQNTKQTRVANSIEPGQTA